MRHHGCLDLEKLSDQAARLGYGIISCYGRKNSLLAELATIFKVEFLIREGKLSVIKRKNPQIDFSTFEIDELKEGFIVFASLAEAFEKSRGSKAVFEKLAQLCYAAANAQAGVGLA